ncbi:FTR1 family protein [Aquihabitans sp. G128]|uniref:FTR1 family iron permease n=1 Tax=Aquihabitans sp. G128 TaxID=2849779 RepID=UPI001C24DA76|nr:FTR1 family protein [Aquihabitans sp. G128]QXC63379.1 FTR1 family protein [Aquihabitans sp. G128]
MSSASFLIALREGFEAALIVAIVLAFVKRSSKPEMARAVWGGTLAALAVATAAGIILHLTLDGLTGKARTNTFAIICVAAAALLTWMIFWMRKNSRHLKKELEGKAGSAIAESSALGLAMVAFLAVVREGLETALFLISATAEDNGRSVVVGTLVGLAVATALGVVIYQGAHKFNMRRFFQVTGSLIIVFAAGLVSKAVAFVQGNTVDVVYNVKGVHWLTSSSEVGKFLAGIFGWDPAPSVLQFVGYWGYLVPALVFFFYEKKSAPAPAATPSVSADGTPASV